MDSTAAPNLQPTSGAGKSSESREMLFKIVEPDGKAKIIYADGSTEGFDFPPGTAFCNYHPRLLAQAIVRLRREALFRAQSERSQPLSAS